MSLNITPPNVIRKFFSFHPRYKSAFLSGGVGTILSFLLSIIVARAISVEERGILQYFLTSITVLMAVCSFGIPFSNSHFEIKSLPKIPDILTYPLIVVSISLGFIFFGEMHDLSVYTILIFSISLVSSLYLSERYKNPSRLHLYSLTIVVQPMAALVFIGVSALYDMSLESIIWAYSASYLSIIIILLIRDRFSVFYNRSFSAGVDYGYIFSYWMATLSSVAVNNVDKIFIFSYLTLYELGLFSVVQGTSSFIGRIGERVAVTTYVNNMEDSLKRPDWLFLVRVLIFSIVFYYFGYFVGLHAIPLVYGDNYAGLSIYNGLMFCATFLGSVAWNMAQQVVADGKPRLNIYRNFLSLLIFITVVQSNLSDDALENVVIAVLISAVSRLIYSLLYLFIRNPNNA